MIKMNLRSFILELLSIQLIITNIIWVPNIISRILALIYFMLGLIALVTGKLKPRLTFFTKLVYVYCFFSLISGIVGGYFSLGVVLSTMQFVCYTIIICCYNYEELTKQILKYFKTIATIMPCSVVYSIILLFFGKTIYKDGVYVNYLNSFILQKGYGYYGNLGYASFFSNSNIWALLLFFSILYYLYVSKSNKKFFYIAIASIGVILADSRAIEICCILIFILKCVEWIKQKINHKELLVFTFMGGLICLEIIISKISNIAEYIIKLDWAGRMQMWQIMLQSIKQHPIFGIGFSMSTKQLLGNKMLGTTVGSHNSYLNILTENGFMGGIIFGFIILYILTIIYKIYIQALDDTDGCYRIVRMVFIIYIIYAFVENALMIVEFRHAIWLMSCLIIEGFYLNLNKRKKVISINQYFK